MLGQATLLTTETCITLGIEACLMAESIMKVGHPGSSGEGRPQSATLRRTLHDFSRRRSLQCRQVRHLPLQQLLGVHQVGAGQRLLAHAVQKRVPLVAGQGAACGRQQLFVRL